MGEFPPRGRQSRGTTREHKLLVHVPAALWECWDPCYWWTYQRHCGMLGPEILVVVPAALCESWAQGVRHKSGHLRWATNPRTGGPRDGRLCQVTPRYFLTRLVPRAGLKGALHGVGGLDLAFTLSLLPPLLFFPRRLCSSARSLPPIASGVSFTSAYLGRSPVVVKMSRVLHLHFDLDDLGHGPPCGRTAALS